jgi:nascent polypeptide-associated complex subunit alpha
MMPNINPRKMQKMMNRMGIQQKPIDAKEVIIKCEDKDIVVKNPNVVKVNMMGQDTIQVTGDITEVSGIKEEDVKTVSEQAGVDEEIARKALEENDGDLAKAILSLKKE